MLILLSAYCAAVCACIDFDQLVHIHILELLLKCIPLGERALAQDKLGDLLVRIVEELILERCRPALLFPYLPEKAPKCMRSL